MDAESAGADGVGQSLWDEIEANYFDSLREVRDAEDRAVEAEFRAKADRLRLELLDNYDSQAQLVRQLQALRDEFADKQAALKAAEDAFRATQEACVSERERENESRRAWFRANRAGGLVLRKAEAPSRVLERAAASAEGDGEMPDARLLTNGNGHGRAALEAENGDGEESAMPDAGPLSDSHELGGVHEAENAEGGHAAVENRLPDAGPLTNGHEHAVLEEENGDETEMPDAGPLANGHEHAALEEKNGDENEMPDAGPLTNGHEHAALEEKNVDENEMSDAGPLANGHEHAALEEENGDENEMPDAGPLTNGHEHAALAEENGDENEMPDAGPLTNGHEHAALEEENVDENEMPDAGPLTNGYEHGSAHEAENGEGALVSAENRRPDAGPLMDGHGRYGHAVLEAEKEMPDAGPLTDGHERGSAREAENDEEGHVAAENGMPDTGAVRHGSENGALRAATNGTVDAGVPAAADDDTADGVEVTRGPELPTDTGPPRTGQDPGVGVQGAESEVGAIQDAGAEQDVGGDQNTGAEQEAGSEQQASNGAPQPDQEATGTGIKPNQAEDEEMTDVQESIEKGPGGAEVADGPAHVVPTAPSPSSSSELSSRGTTPVLDTPMVLPTEPSLPASPGETLSGAIEVVDKFGGLIGRPQPLSSSNVLAERIAERPVKRSVQIRSGRQFDADLLDSIQPPSTDDARAFKWLSLYVQAKGELQDHPCEDCSINRGPYEGCVVVDDAEFPRCGNCEWNKRGCHGAGLQRHSVSAKPPTGSPIETPARGGFTPVNLPSASKGNAGADASGGGLTAKGGTKHGPRKSLPTARRTHAPSTASAGASKMAAASSGQLNEINKEVLCLRDDGVVFTDPPLMRGVPLVKISPEHPYWEENWIPIEQLVEPQLRKYQEKYEQLLVPGSRTRDKHLAHRDVKRGHTILRFLREGDLHPYQLVGKDWITARLTNYDTLYRLSQLVLEELPKFNLDIKPSEWLRHRLCQLQQDLGGKLNVAAWLEKAYHDPKVEQIRAKNGFVSVGRPPVHRMSKGGEGRISSPKLPVPRPLKRKDPDSASESTPRRPNAASSSSSSTSKPSSAAQTKPAFRIKLVSGPRQSAASPNKKPRTAAAARDEEGSPSSALENDGYTTTDSISGDRLVEIDFRVQQVKTRDIASNTGVTQYWHWLGGREGFFEHQVLRSVKPPKWSVFKDPYDFHLRVADMGEVKFARDSGRVVILHKKGPGGEDRNPRGDIMAQFRRERTKRRFLSFLRQKGVRVTEVSSESMEDTWSSLNPTILPGGKSD